MTATGCKLTRKQIQRLDQLADSAKVIGWDDELRGPILRFDTGVSYVVTRDGGIQKV